MNRPIQRLRALSRKIAEARQEVAEKPGYHSALNLQRKLIERQGIYNEHPLRLVEAV
jgi:hypothetical protein